MELRSGLLERLYDDGLKDGWAMVPDRLAHIAEQKIRLAEIAGIEPKVNMRGQHPLAKWGRDKLKEKRKAKIAAASRRRNRNGKR